MIRSARKDDIPSAVALEQQCFSIYRLSRHQLLYLQQCPRAVFLIAELRRQVVGDAIALLRRHNAQTTSARIYTLAVLPSAQGRKIGQQLLRKLLAVLATRGAKRVYLEVEKTNSPAIRLYQRHGFRIIGDLPHYYGRGRTGIHMMRPLPHSNVCGTGILPVSARQPTGRMPVPQSLVRPPKRAAHRSAKKKPPGP